MELEHKLTLKNIVMWLLITATTVFYFLHYRQLLEYLNLFISLIPTIIFIIGGILVFNYDSKRVLKTRANNNYTTTTELNWGQALQHDLLTYFLPVLVLAMPLFFGDVPGIADLLSAVIVFLSLTYVKLLYWHRL